MNRSIYVISFLGLMLAMTCCGSSDSSGYRFWIQDGQLYKGQNPFTIRAIYKPDLLEEGISKEDIGVELNRLCFFGANTVLLDHVMPSGNSEGTPSIARINKVLDEMTYRRMGTILRLQLGHSTAEEIDHYLEELAIALADRHDLILLFSGDKGPEYARAFRNLNGMLVTAAESGAHINVGKPEVGPSKEKPFLIAGAQTEIPAEGIHCYFNDDEPTLQILEKSFLIGESNGFDENAASALLSTEEREEGFIPLFDGESLQGWALTGDPSGWEVADGVIRWVKRGGGYVRSVARYSDFILRLQWRIQEKGNSGLFLRAPISGRWSRIGFEIQLHGDYGQDPHKNGTGSVYDLFPPTINASRPAWEWNDLEITCAGPKVLVRMNDQRVQDVDMTSTPASKIRLRNGFIALQDHGSPVEFRDIRIKVLRQSMF